MLFGTMFLHDMLLRMMLFGQVLLGRMFFHMVLLVKRFMGMPLGCNMLLRSCRSTPIVHRLRDRYRDGHQTRDTRANNPTNHPRIHHPEPSVISKKAGELCAQFKKSAMNIYSFIFSILFKN